MLHPKQIHMLAQGLIDALEKQSQLNAQRIEGIVMLYTAISEADTEPGGSPSDQSQKQASQDPVHTGAEEKEASEEQQN
jgi:hypothetical protein